MSKNTLKEEQLVSPFRSPARMPNGLQWVGNELFVMDQLTDDVFVLDHTGSVRRIILTDTVNGSGITVGGGFMWTASNASNGASARPQRASDYNVANVRKIDLSTGETVGHFAIPDGGGVHGLGWDSGNIWVTLTQSRKLALIDGNTYEVLLEFSCNLNVLHGLAVDGEGIWCADRAEKKLVKYDRSSGDVMEEMQLPNSGPDPHGLSIKNGTLWYSDADFPIADGMRGYPEIGFIST